MKSMRCLALASLFSAASCLGAVSHENLPYAQVDGIDLALDIYLPEEARNPPLIVFIHGGAWRAGTKASGVPLEFVEKGYALASIDFRQSTQARFPAQIHDIKAAIRFLRANAGAYGYDAGRLAITGASSGAHLATLAGVTNGHPELEGSVGEHLDASSEIHAIVSYFGAHDLTTILSQSTPFGLSVREPSLAQLLGDLPDQVPALAELASPVLHVDPRDPPLLLFHGDRDPQMPVNQSLQMEGAYKGQGLDVRFVAVHGAAHGGPAFFSEENLDIALDFLERAFGVGSLGED